MNDLSGRQRLDDMPQVLRWSLVAIKEVGFPIVCCCFLFYIVIVNNAKMTEALSQVTMAISQNTATLAALKVGVDTHMEGARPVIDAYKRELENRRK